MTNRAQALGAFISHGDLCDLNFREMMDALPAAIYLTDAQGRLTYFNAAAAKLSGRAPEIGTDKWCVTWKIFLPDGTPLPHDQCPMALALQGEPLPASMEYIAERPDGTRFWFSPCPAVVRDAEGRVTGGINLLIDITDRKKLEIEATEYTAERMRIERAALLLSAIVDSSDDAIISKDLTGVITSWNHSAQRLFGYTAEEAIGQTVASLLIPEDRQSEEPDILARLARGERVDHFETVRRTKDGTLLDISLTISPVRNARGVIIGASKIARDITEAKRTQTALLKSEAQFRQLADAMPQIVWTAHPDGFVDYFNERWFQFTGFPSVPLDGADWLSIVHPDDLTASQDSWQAALDSGESCNIECRFRHRRDGLWRWFLVRAVPVRDAQGNVLKWFGTCTDIDHQKRAQDELRRANYDLEQFAFTASHDLQEPLRGVKIYSELLARRHSDKLGGEALKFLDYVRNSATRMEALIRDLLAYTQVTVLDQPDELVDAGEAVKTALANLSGAIADSGARIEVGTMPSLPVNVTHLQQLFQNLIGNAIKYRSPQRPPIVQLQAERRREHWLFRVTDNGIGIEPEYKKNIFGLFKRLHNSDEYSGTGIGLAICQRIVDRYRGRIWVESEPGQGSTFFFTLPA